MVSPGDALPHRAHEEDCPLNARTPRIDPQLFPRSEAALQRRRRRTEQQSQSHYEKILWISYLPLPRTRALSLTWQITGTGINPRFFLTNLFLRTTNYGPTMSSQAARLHFACSPSTRHSKRFCEASALLLMQWKWLRHSSCIAEDSRGSAKADHRASHGGRGAS